MFLQQLINGITLGAIYALIALGYTMVYGILEFINFAHGEIFMMGAYFSLLIFGFLQSMGFNTGNIYLTLFLVFLGSMFLCGLLGVIIERIAYRPLRNAPRLACLITAVGVSLFLQNLAMLIFGSENKIFPTLFTSGYLPLEEVRISFLHIFIFLSSVILMILLELFIKKTKLGMAMRATAQDKEIAQAMGINIDNIISLTFFIGSALAAAAGILVGMYYGVVRYDMGYLAGIKAFTAAVLGGIGNIPGAMLGGFTLGILENFGAAYISADYKDAFAFAILVSILLLRPRGLLGERLPEKI